MPASDPFAACELYSYHQPFPDLGERDTCTTCLHVDDELPCATLVGRFQEIAGPTTIPAICPAVDQEVTLSTRRSSTSEGSGDSGAGGGE